MAAHTEATKTWSAVQSPSNMTTWDFVSSFIHERLSLAFLSSVFYSWIILRRKANISNQIIICYIIYSNITMSASTDRFAIKKNSRGIKFRYNFELNLIFNNNLIIRIYIFVYVILIKILFYFIWYHDIWIEKIRIVFIIFSAWIHDRLRRIYEIFS